MKVFFLDCQFIERIALFGVKDSLPNFFTALAKNMS
jgi:hypothetical protein